MTIDSVRDSDHNGCNDDEDGIPDQVVKAIGKRRENQYSSQFEQHFGNADPSPGIHVLVGDDERSVGDADELEEHGCQRTVEDYLCCTDAFDRNDHLLVDVPKSDDFAEKDQQNGHNEVQAQCRVERSTDIGLRASSDFDRDEALGGEGQRAGDDGERSHKIADDGIDGKVVNTKNAQDDSGRVKVNNQHKRRTQVQRYRVAGQ